MISRITPIVEGHGEVISVRQLIELILATEGLHVEVTRPIRLDRGKIVKPDELRRYAKLAEINAGNDGGVLLLFDADNDCPVELKNRCEPVMNDLAVPYAIAVANRMYESWFLASIASLSGHRGLLPSLVSPEDPETVKYPKSWLESKHSKNQAGGKKWSYSETLDQVAFTSRISIPEARKSRSFVHIENAVKVLANS